MLIKDLFLNCQDEELSLLNANLFEQFLILFVLVKSFCSSTFRAYSFSVFSLINYIVRIKITKMCRI